jgi:hypothetical protein
MGFESVHEDSQEEGLSMKSGTGRAPGHGNRATQEIS